MPAVKRWASRVVKNNGKIDRTFCSNLKKIDTVQQVAPYEDDIRRAK